MLQGQFLWFEYFSESPEKNFELDVLQSEEEENFFRIPNAAIM